MNGFFVLGSSTGAAPEVSGSFWKFLGAGVTSNNNNNNKRPLTPKSMPPAGDEHAKLKT